MCIFVHPVNERNHFRNWRDSGGISNNVSAIPSDTLHAINFSGIDVTRKEVCVCCFKVFRLVSEFIRHADRHDGAGERKQTFIKTRTIRQTTSSRSEPMSIWSSRRAPALSHYKQMPTLILHVQEIHKPRKCLSITFFRIKKSGK